MLKFRCDRPAVGPEETLSRILRDKLDDAGSDLVHVPLPDVVEAWRAEFGEDEVSPNYLGRLTRTIGVREERRKMIAGAKTRVYAVRRNDLR